MLGGAIELVSGVKQLLLEAKELAGEANFLGIPSMEAWATGKGPWP